MSNHPSSLSASTDDSAVVEPLGAIVAEGGCLCGAVRFSASPLPTTVTQCHCSMCRRFHGHVGPYVTLPLWAFSLRDPQHALRWYRSSPEAERGFCSVCGSSLFWRRIGGGEIDIAAGTLDGLTGLRTVRHIFVASKGDYYEIADGAEQRAQR